MTRNTRMATCCIAGSLLVSPENAFAGVAARLTVHENRRYIQYQDGRPFFYLGDTAESCSIA